MEPRKPEIFDGKKWVDCCINCSLRGIIQMIKAAGDGKSDRYIWQCSDSRKILQGNPAEIHGTCDRIGLKGPE